MGEKQVDKYLGSVQLNISKKELYQMLAEALDDQGNNKEAIRYFMQSLWEYEQEKKPDPLWEISFWSSISLTYINGYQYNEAKQALNRVMSLVEKISVSQKEYEDIFLTVSLNMGLLYMRLLEYDKAEDCLFVALNFCKRKEDEFKITINLGWLYLSMWQNERAIDYAYMALQIIKDIPSTRKDRDDAEIYQLLSQAYARLGREEEGLRLIDEAIGLQENVPSVYLCRCLCLKGIILRKMDRKASLEFHQKALDMLFELKMEDTELLLTILANKIESEEDFCPEEIELMKKAVDNGNLPDSYYKMNIFTSIVSASLSLGSMAEAFYYSARALEIYQRLVTEAVRYGSVEKLINYKKDMRFFYELFFLGLMDRVPDLSGIPGDSPLMLWMQNYKLGDYYLLRQIRQPSGEEDADADRYHLAAELNYLNYMSEFLHRKPETERQHKLLLEKSRAEYNSFRGQQDSQKTEEAEEENRYEGFWCMDYYCPEYKRFRAHTCGFVIVWQFARPESKRIVKIGDAVSLKDSILQLRDAVVRDVSTQAQAQKLYQLLLAPVMEEVPDLKKVQKFIICPDGMLALVPFEILLGPGCRILYIPFMDLLQGKKSQYVGRAAVGGCPVITRENLFGLSPLQHSGEECDSVAGALRSVGHMVEVFSGNGEIGGKPFSKAEFLKYIEEEPLSIIHLSSHGFYREQENMFFISDTCEEMDNPYKRCGIIMNDVVKEHGYCPAESVLFGEDVLCLNLKNTRLVVLSACVSGVGSGAGGEWLTGLQRAFLSAGAENMIVSLWEVEEESTAVLMNYFYGYLKEGMFFDMALCQAKKDLIRYQGGIYSTPFYWAGFIYIGNIESMG